MGEIFHIIVLIVAFFVAVANSLIFYFILKEVLSKYLIKVLLNDL